MTRFQLPRCNPQVALAVSRCLAPDPSMRPTASDLLALLDASTRHHPAQTAPAASSSSSAEWQWTLLRTMQTEIDALRAQLAEKTKSTSSPGKKRRSSHSDNHDDEGAGDRHANNKNDIRENSVPRSSSSSRISSQVVQSDDISQWRDEIGLFFSFPEKDISSSPPSLLPPLSLFLLCERNQTISSPNLLLPSQKEFYRFVHITDDPPHFLFLFFKKFPGKKSLTKKAKCFQKEKRIDDKIKKRPQKNSIQSPSYEQGISRKRPFWVFF